MKKFLKIFVFILIFTQSSCAQKYDENLVSEMIELNFANTKMRGIKNNKIIYFVENNLQTVSAYENGKLKWETNIIAVCGKPEVGKSEIRYVKLEEDKLVIVFGKHSFAEVNKNTGKTKFIGSD